jgi:hypothetical protein
VSVRAFFQLVDTMGSATSLSASEYARKVPSEALRAALGASGIVTRGTTLRAIACEEQEDGCMRAVVEEEGAIGRWLAVCERVPAACAPSVVDAAQIASVRVVHAALVRLLRALYDVDASDTTITQRAARASDEPIFLGVREAGRDVFFVRRPDARLLAAFLREREDAARKTLVLVPTTRALAPVVGDAATRYGRGGDVTIEALAETIVLRGGSLVLAPRLYAVEPKKKIERAQKSNARSESSVRLLWKLERWSDLHVFLIDAETVGIKIGRRHWRRTAADFGEAHDVTRVPSHQWRMLVAMCKGGGAWRWKTFGGYGAVKTKLTRLRRTLRDAFGLEADPLYGYHEEWKPRFRAHATPPDEALFAGDETDRWSDE